MTRRLAIIAMLAAATGFLCGCDGLAWILVKTVGPWVPEDAVEAQFDLKGKSVLVLVDMKEPSLASEYPRLESLLADAINKVLVDKKACGPVVPSVSVETARQAEPKFAEWSVAQVGKYFNVDVVLHVEMQEFRLKDTPSSNVYHGYTEAAVRLVAPDSGQQIWPVLAAARIMGAETQPDVEVEEHTEQEAILIDGFADKIARHFFGYKKNEMPMRPKVK